MGWRITIGGWVESETTSIQPAEERLASLALAFFFFFFSSFCFFSPFARF
jgi:hypothetical protein